MKKLATLTLAVILALVMTFAITACYANEPPAPAPTTEPVAEATPAPAPEPTPEPTPEPEPEPEEIEEEAAILNIRGSWNGNVYTSEFLGLQLAVQDTWAWTINSDEEIFEEIEMPDEMRDAIYNGGVPSNFWDVAVNSENPDIPPFFDDISVRGIFFRTDRCIPKYTGLIISFFPLALVSDGSFDEFFRTGVERYKSLEELMPDAFSEVHELDEIQIGSSYWKGVTYIYREGSFGLIAAYRTYLSYNIDNNIVTEINLRMSDRDDILGGETLEESAEIFSNEVGDDFNVIYTWFSPYP